MQAIQTIIPKNGVITIMLTAIDVRFRIIQLAIIFPSTVQQFFHPLDIPWHIHARTVIIHFNDPDLAAVSSALLLQLLRVFAHGASYFTA